MYGWIQDINDRKKAELNLQGALSGIEQLKDKLEAERMIAATNRHNDAGRVVIKSGGGAV
jgi:hypothetical protein